jgi:hypothetical protein
MAAGKKYMCVDLDGTIAHYDGWKGEDHFGEPITGVQDALGGLRDEGWVVIVFTTRRDTPRIEEYLRRNAIPYDYVNRNPEVPGAEEAGKPFAHVYVDDRAVPFDGDWKRAMERVRTFRTWEELKAERHGEGGGDR